MFEIYWETFKSLGSASHLSNFHNFVCGSLKKFSPSKFHSSLVAMWRGKFSQIILHEKSPSKTILYVYVRRNFSAILPGEITHEDKCDFGVLCGWVEVKKLIKVRLRQYRDTRRDIYLLFDVTSKKCAAKFLFLRCNQISKATFGWM